MTTQLVRMTREQSRAIGSFIQTSLFAIIAFVSFSLNNCIHAQITDSARSGSAEVKTFQSKILGESRTIFIQTPTKMKSTDQYPVLYLLDGESFINLAAGQIQYLSESYKIIPSLIIVGIKSVDRFKDLTPNHSLTIGDAKPDTNANSPLRTSGGGNKFLQFIKEELFPYIETNYPTAPYRILYGHSLGGLLAVHAFVNHPDLFNAYIAISPSFQWDKEWMLKTSAEKLDSKKLAGRILFFSDANEDARFHQNQLSFDSILKKKNIAGLNYKYAFYPNETHISEPVKAFYDGIRHVYPMWHLPYNSSAFRNNMRSDTIIRHYDKLSTTYHYKILPPEDEITAISRFFANDTGRLIDAIELLKMNAENHPKSSSIYELLGDVYLKMKNTEEAKASYQKALALEPSNNSIGQKMKKLSH